MSLIDTWLVYKFIRLLVTPFDETDAFKLGVINNRGKVLIHVKNMTDKQLESFSLFNRLVFNIKKLIELVPGGKTKIGSYAAALFLLREQLDSDGVLIMEKSFLNYLKDVEALESTYLEEQYLPEEMLSQGNYKLVNSMLDIKGEQISKGTVVVAIKSLKPLARVLGVDVFQLQVGHSTGKMVVVSRDDISEV